MVFRAGGHARIATRSVAGVASGTKIFLIPVHEIDARSNSAKRFEDEDDDDEDE